MRLVSPVAVLLLGASLAGACEDNEAPVYEGVPGVPVAASYDGWVPTVRITFTIGETVYADRALVVDTGAPLTILDASSFPGLADGRHDATLEVFGLTIPAWDVVTWDLPGDETGVFDGLLGGDLLRHFALSLDYRDERAWLSDPFDPAALPADVQVEPLASVPMRVDGGGWGMIGGGCTEDCLVELAPTRVILQAQFEARTAPVWILVDTGASAVVLDSGFLEELEESSPGRPRLDGVTVMTVEGDVAAYMTRVWRAELASPSGEASAVALEDLAVLVIPGDDLLLGLSAELGIRVEALVGGSALREFLTTIDYSAHELLLGRYLHPTHIAPDEFIGVGFALERTSIGSWRVTDVYGGTDAEAEGIARGDVVEEIDGTPIGGASSSVVGNLLAGFGLGEEVPVGLRGAGGVEVRLVLVEDLLPSFPPP